MRTKAALDGTYRLMKNKKVTPEGLIEPHLQQSIARTCAYDRVLLVQDTTEVDLSKPERQIEGAGPLSAQSRRGFYLHPLMAYTTQGVPLGLVECLHWSRVSIDTTSSASEKRKRQKTVPIEEKESYRWVEMTRSGKQIARAQPSTEYVGISDSESDIYEVFSEVQEGPQNYHLLIRACYDRAITEDETLSPDTEPGESQKISGALKSSSPSFRIEIEVSARTAKMETEQRKRRQTRGSRRVLGEVRVARVTLRPPRRCKGKLPPISCNIVDVREIDPPDSEEPVHWTLVTTLPIDNEGSIREIIEAYKTRWSIELYFKTLKSGLGLEKLQYQTLPRYLNAVMPLLIVAWQVQMLTHVSRAEPDACCEDYVEAVQWQPLWLLSHPEKSLPESAPSIHEVMMMVARMGGYIKRKGQGPPGTNVVWRGMRRLEILTMAYAAFGQQNR
jgi:IS4 transposase